MLSHTYWQNRFDSDPNIVGQTIRLNGSPMTIVGVVEPRFHGVDIGFNPQVMAPVSMTKSLKALSGVFIRFGNRKVAKTHVGGFHRIAKIGYRVADQQSGGTLGRSRSQFVGGSTH